MNYFDKPPSWKTRAKLIVLKLLKVVDWTFSQTLGKSFPRNWKWRWISVLQTLRFHKEHKLSDHFKLKSFFMTTLLENNAFEIKFIYSTWHVDQAKKKRHHQPLNSSTLKFRSTWKKFASGGWQDKKSFRFRVEKWLATSKRYWDIDFRLICEHFWKSSTPRASLQTQAKEFRHKQVGVFKAKTFLDKISSEKKFAESSSASLVN